MTFGADIGIGTSNNGLVIKMESNMGASTQGAVREMMRDYAIAYGRSVAEAKDAEIERLLAEVNRTEHERHLTALERDELRAEVEALRAELAAERADRRRLGLQGEPEAGGDDE